MRRREFLKLTVATAVAPQLPTPEPAEVQSEPLYQIEMPPDVKMKEYPIGIPPWLV